MKRKVHVVLLWGIGLLSFVSCNTKNNVSVSDSGGIIWNESIDTDISDEITTFNENTEISEMEFTETEDPDTSTETQSHIETYKDHLYTPTQIKKIGDLYFIVDCWQGRVIYSDNLSMPVSLWNTLTDTLKGGHTIASDGKYIIIDDSDHFLILVYDMNLSYVKSIPLTGRPHFTYYDETTSLFYVLTSDGYFYELEDNDGISLKKSLQIEEIYGNYTRSFSVIDGYFYFPTANGYIYKMKKLQDSFLLEDTYYLSKENNGMNYIEKIGDFYYITLYTDSNFVVKPGIIKIKSFDDLKENTYEDIYEKYDFKGVPYFISYFDEKYFITEIDTAQGISAFKDDIGEKTYIYFEEGVSEVSKLRKAEMNE